MKAISQIIEYGGRGADKDCHVGHLLGGLCFAYNYLISKQAHNE